MSSSLSDEIRFGLSELEAVCEQILPFTLRPADAELTNLELFAICAMLHSYYTEIEKILKRIAIRCGEPVPSGDSWHRALLDQMSQPGVRRPPVVSSELLSSLRELLAFRHVFRGASIVLMRWDKLQPLVSEVPRVHTGIVASLRKLLDWLNSEPGGSLAL